MATGPLHHNELWETLVATAILGTERRPFIQLSAGGALGAALEALDTSQGERALLEAAALVSAYRRAGTVPEVCAAQPGAPESPDDDLPVCSPRAVAHLLAMLNGTHSVVLPEWLSALAAAGKRAPPSVLPEILEAGRTRSALRPLIRAVSGARGRWLAAQNPDWEYAAGAAAPAILADPAAVNAVWQTGSSAARRALLDTMRSVAPDAGRALLESTWADERAEDRVAFLQCMETGLSMADEPFLEGALDNRSKEVRAAAAGLLARLPESRLVHRMIARLAPLLRRVPPERSWLPGLVQERAGSIDMTLPEMCDRAMVRDGVDTRESDGASPKERVQWLHQMLRGVPPAHWCACWNATPADLIAAAARSKWRDAILPAWIYAAWNTRDADWAEALLRLDPSHAELLPLLPVERQEALLLDLLAEGEGLLGLRRVTGLLRQTRHTWRPHFARAVLAAVRNQISNPLLPVDYGLHGALTDFALRLPPDLLPEIVRDWRGLAMHEQWQGAIDRLLATLQFRSDMLQALRD